ncbi:MAG TPA: low molecular weight protein arginine phosphatase [Dehalococcoidia bacterium]|nr:low molecular weight protein arginine phosphatase [Dehalococcoidia bacterium]
MLPHNPESAFPSSKENLPYRSILFICDANTCRSPMSEAMLKKMLVDFEGKTDEFRITSAGISPNARDGSDMTFDARWLLKEEGIHVETFRSRDLKRHRELLEEADLVLTMSQEQKKRVHQLAEANGKEICTLKEFVGEAGDIADPFGRGEEVYDQCRDEIKRCLYKLITRLIPDHSL